MKECRQKNQIRFESDIKEEKDKPKKIGIRKRPKLLFVRWYDCISYTEADWRTVPNVMKLEIQPIESVGWFICESEISITLVHSWQPPVLVDGETQSVDICGEIVIPKGAIIGRPVELKTPKLPKKKKRVK